MFANHRDRMDLLIRRAGFLQVSQNFLTLMAYAKTHWTKGSLVKKKKKHIPKEMLFL